MISLCQPYSVEITCLCDETASVLRCFLTREEGDSDNHIQDDMVTVANNRRNIDFVHKHQQSNSSVHCNMMGEMTTEIIMATAIVLLVIVIIYL